MMTLANFLWLIHYILIAMYVYTIGNGIYLESQYRAIIENAYATDPKMYEKETDEFVKFFAILFSVHCMAYAAYIEAVPVVLMVLIILTAIFAIRNSAQQPYIKAYKARSGANTKHSTHDSDDFADSAERREDGEYHYRNDRFRDGASRANGGAADDREQDYASALRDAQTRANEISDHQAAKFAKVWEKMAKEPGLDPKIRLYRELVAMLLRERAKGFRGRPDTTPPTDDEIKGILFAPDR